MNLFNVPETPERDDDARTLAHSESIQPEHTTEHILNEGFNERKNATPIDKSKTGPEPAAAYRDERMSHPVIKPVSVDSSQFPKKPKNLGKCIIIIVGFVLILLVAWVLIY